MQVRLPKVCIRSWRPWRHPKTRRRGRCKGCWRREKWLLVHLNERTRGAARSNSHKLPLVADLSPDSLFSSMRHRAGQGRAGQGRAGQGRAGQGRAGQGRAGQGRAGQRRATQTKHGRSSKHHSKLALVLSQDCQVQSPCRLLQF